MGNDPWTDDERGHIENCSGCQKSEEWVRAATQSDLQHLQSRAEGVLDSDTSTNDGGLANLGSKWGHAEDSEWTQNGAMIGPYQLIETVARGGMSVVYKALDTRLSRMVAIKVSSSLGPSGTVMDRFFREARVLAKLSHPSLLRILDVGEHHDLIYIVSPLIIGSTLRSRAQSRGCSLLREGQQISPSAGQREVAEIMQEIASAVHYIHERGIVHRDIKPSNIMIDSELHRPMLLDFGLAVSSAEEATLTREQSVVGTPAYMPPEQKLGKMVDSRSDIWALGATLFFLLTGHTPNDTLSSFPRSWTEFRPPRSPRSYDRDVSPELDSICLAAMAVDPKDRYESARAMAEDLSRFVRGEPVGRGSVTLSRFAGVAHRLAKVARSALNLPFTAFAAKQGRGIEPRFRQENQPAAQARSEDQAVSPGEVVQALNELGRLHREHNQMLQAEEAYLRSVRVLEMLISIQPNEVIYRLGQAEARRELVQIRLAQGENRSSES